MDLPTNVVNTSILNASNSDQSVFPSDVTKVIVLGKDGYTGIHLPPSCMVDSPGDVANADIPIESNSSDSDSDTSVSHGYADSDSMLSKDDIGDRKIQNQLR